MLDLCGMLEFELHCEILLLLNVADMGRRWDSEEYGDSGTTQKKDVNYKKTPAKIYHQL